VGVSGGGGGAKPEEKTASDVGWMGVPHGSSVASNAGVWWGVGG